MANYNTTAWQRWDNSCTVGIASASNDIKNIVPGSVRRRRMSRDRIGNIDRGTLGSVTVGNEQPQEIEFEVWRTSETEALITALTPAATNGLETFLTLVVRVPNYLNAAAGQGWTYTKCYLDPRNGIEEVANPGSGGDGDADRVRFRFINWGPDPGAVSY